MVHQRLCSIAAILAACGATYGVPTITVDGRYTPGDDVEYGAAKWTQSTPTNRGDNDGSVPIPCGAGNGTRIAIDNSNALGVTFGTDAADTAAAEAVTTGFEFAIPLSQLGNPTGVIRIAGFINGSGNNFLSNQILGAITAPRGNLGGNGTGTFIGNIGGINFANETQNPGNQFVEVPNSSDPTVITAPAINGTVEFGTGGFYEGTRRWTNSVQTQFGDSTLGVQDFASGSELDALYTRVAVADLGDGPQKYLFIGLTGNLESNFNHLQLFFDTDSSAPVPAGQNIMRGDNTNADGLPQAAGLTFDTGFTADYYLNMRGGNNPYEYFIDYASLPTNGGGSFTASGSGNAGPLPRNSVINVSCPSVPDTWISGGSELNQVFSYVDLSENTLHLLITGNLRAFEEDKLHIFIDADGAAGQAALLSPDANGAQRNVQVSEADGGGGALRRMAPAVFGEAGLKLDIAADYYFNFHFEDLNIRRTSADAAVLRTNGFLTEVPNTPGAPYDYGTYKCVGGTAGVPAVIDFNGDSFCDFNVNTVNGISFQDGFFQSLNSHYPPRLSSTLLFGGSAAFGGPATDQASFDTYINGIAPAAGQLLVVLDNRNIAGVTATDASGAATATNGFEISVDLDEIGWNGTSPIRIAGFISNGGVNTIYNQYLGDQTSAGSLGDPRAVDFTAIAGNQYIEVYSVGQSPCQLADFNDMDGVTADDIFAFLDAWFAQNGVCVSPATCSADINGMDDVTADDIFAFLDLWFTWNGTVTCP